MHIMKNMQIVFLAAALSIAVTVHSYPSSSYEPEQTKKNYAFSYGVKDEYEGLDFNQDEQSDGHSVKGVYSVQLPDGRKQIVNYEADHENGFNANVQYEGHAQFPPASKDPPFIVPSQHPYSPPKPAPAPYSPPKHAPAPYSPPKHAPAPYTPFKDTPAPYTPPKHEPVPYSPPKYAPTPAPYSPPKQKPATYSPPKKQSKPHLLSKLTQFIRPKPEITPNPYDSFSPSDLHHHQPSYAPEHPQPSYAPKHPQPFYPQEHPKPYRPETSLYQSHPITQTLKNRPKLFSGNFLKKLFNRD